MKAEEQGAEMGLEHTLSAQPWGRDKEGSRQPTVPSLHPQHFVSVWHTTSEQEMLVHMCALYFTVYQCTINCK